MSHLEEASGFANIHGQVYTKVNILCPCILTQEDVTIQMGLQSCLRIVCHSSDRNTKVVPGHLVSISARLDEHDNGPTVTHEGGLHGSHSGSFCRVAGNESQAVEFLQ